MGGYAGAEKSEIVDLYLLSLLKQVIKEVGLYRDDGLDVISIIPRQNKKLKQDIIRIFKQEGLSITINENLQNFEFFLCGIKF